RWGRNISRRSVNGWPGLASNCGAERYHEPQRDALSGSAMLDQARFAKLWQRLGAESDVGALFAALAASYAAPHPAYHRADHIGDCLSQFDAARTLALRPDEVEFALWFHDAVYDPKRADNEERSAAWAAQALMDAGVSAETTAHVSQLIVATKHASVPDDPD